MFGHDDDKKDQAEHHDDLQAPAPDQSDAQASDDQPAVSTDDSWQHPGTPLNDGSSDDTASAPMVSPAGGFPRSTDAQASSHPEITVSAPEPAAPAVAEDIVNINSTVQDLIDIRQHALTELAPLLDQLELSSEDRFRILMLVIQSSDDQKLIKEAYEAAHGISDQKVRAQALFDLVNEINYFTQQQPEA